MRFLQTLFKRQALDADMTAEMRHHVDLQTELNRQAGMTPEDARYAALRQFGNVASLQQQVREDRGWIWLEHWTRDLRVATRGLIRSPGFSVSVFITLMLCIGPNTAVWSALQAFVLKDPPFASPQQLVVIKN